MPSPALSREVRLCLASEKSDSHHDAHPGPEHGLVTCHALDLIHILSTFDAMQKTLRALRSHLLACTGFAFHHGAGNRPRIAFI